MKNLDAKTVPIGKLLSQEFFFRVPAYQRPFSWDADNFDNLVEDIVTANNDQEYFLGTIVLHELKEAGHFDVVDGQQRLTSLLILFACLRDLVENNDFKSDLQNKILQRKNVVDGIPEKVRLEVKDREIFQKIVVAENGTRSELNVQALPEPEWRYANAVEVFRSKLLALSQPEIERVITFLNQRCVAIYLATATFDDAFRLFTIVNDRGKQLRRIDILKAINIAPSVISKDTVREKVSQQWEDMEKNLGEDTFEGVFHLLRLILLKDKPQGDLLKEFEGRIFAKGTLTKGEPFLNLIFEYCKLYDQIFEERTIVPESDSDHNKFRALIHIMHTEFQASEWRACLLLYAYRHGAKGFYAFCLALEKVYLSQWVKGIRKDERYADYSKILGLIENAKKPTDISIAKFADAKVTKDAAGGKNIYTAGFGKYFLLRLEIVAAEHDNPREFSAKSVEHILPQAPPEDGYWAEHHNLDQISQYVNSLGNLVLLSKSKNSSARNFDFAKKKDKYLKARVSDYPRSIQILAYDKWDRATIDSRTAEAQELLLKDP